MEARNQTKFNEIILKHTMVKINIPAFIYAKIKAGNIMEKQR